MRRIRVPVALALTLSMPGAFLMPSVSLASVPPPPSGPATQPAPQPQPQPQNLSEDEKIELAKQKYAEAEVLAAEGNYVDAVVLYEEAYYLVPGKHGFAHKVGVTAFKAGDCDKANTYLKHFIQYGDAEKQGDKFDEAKQILGEISVSGCATDSGGGGGGGGGSNSSDPTDYEDPLGESTKTTRQKDAAQAREDKKNEKRGLLIGGAALTAVGVVGLGVGFAGLGIASKSAGSLQDLSSNSTNTGFPSGDYACRDVPTSECPYQLEGRMKTGNVLAYVGLPIGGAALIGGVAMLAIYMANKKKNGGGLEEAPAVEGEAGVAISGLGPMMLPGGGGAMVELRF
ncbi:MAG: hypothetical protein KC457_30145 [Myxococcales bacterium]|nr:hypothetical protein [Myxococcales bacterium]